jgi:signal transduction histidine kinase
MLHPPAPFRVGVLVLSLASYLFLPVQAAQANAIQGQVSCDKGVDMPKVQALVKRTVAALRKDLNTVTRQITASDPQWKDGYYYIAVFRGTTLLAHPYFPQLVGHDLGTTTYLNTFPFITVGERIALQQGGGCMEYRMHNPAKGGQVEDKIGYSLPVSGQVWAVSGTYLLK